MAKTSGGLIKRSMTFAEDQLRELEALAAERHTSTAAIMREMVQRGLDQYRQEQQFLRESRDTTSLEKRGAA